VKAADVLYTLLEPMITQLPLLLLLLVHLLSLLLVV
jgi:hypothetical protein